MYDYLNISVHTNNEQIKFRSALYRLQPACIFTNLILYLGTNCIILNETVFLIAKVLTDFRSFLKASPSTIRLIVHNFLHLKKKILPYAILISVGVKYAFTFMEWQSSLTSHKKDRSYQYSLKLLWILQKKKKALLNSVHLCNRHDTTGLWCTVSHATNYHLFDILLDTLCYFNIQFSL